MERPRKINFPFLMLTLLFILTQTAFALSSTLSYDGTNGNVQGKQTEEEINLKIENVKANAINYLIAEIAEKNADTSDLFAHQVTNYLTPHITTAEDNIVSLTDINSDGTDIVAASAVNAEVQKPAEPTPTPKPEIKSVVKHVNADKLNVRQEASSQSSLVTSIKRGDKVTYYETIGEWARIITWTDRKGYVLAKYLVDSADKVDKVVVQKPKTEEIIVASRGTEEKTEEVAPPSPESANLADDIIAYAKTWLGVPYRWAGNSKNGTDCSGLTYYVFKHFGISVPRSSYAYLGTGTKVSRSDIKKGDIILWDIDRNGTVGHVGIYIGDGMFIHASSSKGKVVTRALATYSEKYLGARRVIK